MRVEPAHGDRYTERMNVTTAHRIAPLLPAAPAAGTREAQLITTVEDSALQVRDLLQHDATAAADVSQAAQALRQSVLSKAVTLAPEAAADAVRQASLAALQGGMMCGVLDGLVMLCASQTVADAPVPVPAQLEGKRDLMNAGLAAAREVAQKDWNGMAMDDLQLLAGYGKHQNLHTGDESQALVGRTANEQAEWLMATFKAGYAIGVADAVILARGENPDPTV